MSAFGKIGNVLCIILAWILSIALVVMLLVAPLAMSALSLLNSETIAEVVVDLFMEMVEQEGQGGTAADYQLTLMSNTTVTIPQDVLDQLPQDIQDSLQKGEINRLPQDVLDQLPEDVVEQLPEDVVDQSTQTAPQDKPQGSDSNSTNNGAVADLLESYLGVPVTQETVQKVMSSTVVKEVIQAYAGDLTNVITGQEKMSELDAQKIKTIVDNNMDEVVTLVQEIQTEVADTPGASGTPSAPKQDVEALKQEIMKVVEEKAEEIIQVLPKPEQVKEEIVEENPELEIVLDILAKKDTIELATVAVIVVLCVLIFLCRLWGFRGFRWLAVIMFVAGGLNAILGVTLKIEIPMILNLLPKGIPVKVINNVLTTLDKAMLVRAVAMVVVGGVLLTAYILIKKMRNKKIAATVEE